MISIKTPKMIEGMKASGRILRSVHEELSKIIVPGISTLEIDSFVEKFLAEHGATPEQKGYMGFPFATCASVNDEICHGFPSEKPLKEGDIVTIDMVVNKDGYLSDSAWSYAVGEISNEAKLLMDVTKEALYKGIEVVKPGAFFGDIGIVIEEYVKQFGFSIVEDFCGHGIGRYMHEDPQVLHYNSGIRGARMREGMVFTIEPMINVGTWKMKLDKNGWTARTADGKLSCQYEHTMAVTKDGVRILTDEGLDG
ncbi:MAG: type I methionyl aminopeptidase [Ezakiella sp.]|nr:type I methionyl aminopeptidase [Ezakiella sp.]MDD7472075.1 type I methionyl aminopeptidase [Bacillota bacterium]MDY3924039.1 type I methionyl aminopeptidase [Ezakiella sp.]